MRLLINIDLAIDAMLPVRAKIEIIQKYTVVCWPNGAAIANVASKENIKNKIVPRIVNFLEDKGSDCFDEKI